MLSDVCLSVTHIGPKSRTERPKKTKIGTEVAHLTRDSDTTFKVKRSRSQGRGILWQPPTQLVCQSCADQLPHSKDHITCVLLVAAILTFLVSDVPLMENDRLPTLAHLLGTHYLTIDDTFPSAFHLFDLNYSLTCLLTASALSALEVSQR